MSETNGMNINLGSLVQLGNLLSNLSQLNTLYLQGHDSLHLLALLLAAHFRLGLPA